MTTPAAPTGTAPWGPQAPRDPGRARRQVAGLADPGPAPRRVAGLADASDHRHLARLAATLGTTTLADLAETSDLQTRVDQKYLVPLAVLDELVASLDSDLRVLEIDGRRVFGYESVYFDTCNLQLFRDQVQGRRTRHKVRTRLYADSGLTMLEVKAKGRRGETVKHRLDWRREDLLQIHSEGRDFVGTHLAGRPHVAVLRPVLRSTYRRMTLVHVAGGLRVTCDVDLAFEGPGGGAVRVPGGQVLLETKSATGAARPTSSCAAGGSGTCWSASTVRASR
ncbi:polyphosphate polymerase domain-containing protein [Intrasporangium sp.]|uniref:polyphosphate polymerase domain-containing protein n=1 Tax=Intrasporangium sp. TaxID=1925024 RepID=UPI00322213B9